MARWAGTTPSFWLYGDRAESQGFGRGRPRAVAKRRAVAPARGRPQGPANRANRVTARERPAPAVRSAAARLLLARVPANRARPVVAQCRRTGTERGEGFGSLRPSHSSDAGRHTSATSGRGEARQ